MINLVIDDQWPESDQLSLLLPGVAVLMVDHSLVDLETIEALYENVRQPQLCISMLLTDLWTDLLAYILKHFGLCYINKIALPCLAYMHF